MGIFFIRIPIMDVKELDSSSTHAIVQMSENDTLGKSIRLVPCLWMAKTDDKWVCLYPQKKDSSQVETMVKESVPPRADFDRYDIKIVKEASTFIVSLETYLLNVLLSINNLLIIKNYKAILQLIINIYINIYNNKYL